MYHQLIEQIESFDYSQRRVPVIPSADKKLRVIIDTDARNEVDDPWAIALALLSPERFQIEALIGANFDVPAQTGGPDGVEQSCEEIETILEKAGMGGAIPVLPGAHPMRYQYEPSEAPGVDCIIETALQCTPEDPLWVIGLGAATDMASAFLKEPRIVDRVVAFWHFRTQWPNKCINFNVVGDIRAARIVFQSPLPFVLFDTGGHLNLPMEQSEEHVRPCGLLGEYLHTIRLRHPTHQVPHKGFFDLGDIAALLAPEIASWEVVHCPEVNYFLDYEFTYRRGRILRCCDIDRDQTFDLLTDRLRRAVT